MPTSTSTSSTITVYYILNILNMSNVDSGYLPWSLVAIDDNSNMFVFKHIGL